MQTSKESLQIAFGVYLFATFVAAWMKVMHFTGADNILMLSFVTAIIFLVMALREIWASPAPRNEKILWTVFFILINGLASIAYMLFGRKRIMSYTRDENA